MGNVMGIAMIAAIVVIYSFLWYRIGIAVAECEQEKKKERYNSGNTERVERVEAYEMPSGFNSNNRFY